MGTERKSGGQTANVLMDACFVKAVVWSSELKRVTFKDSYIQDLLHFEVQLYFMVVAIAGKTTHYGSQTQHTYYSLCSFIYKFLKKILLFL